MPDLPKQTSIRQIRNIGFRCKVQAIADQFVLSAERQESNFDYLIPT